MMKDANVTLADAKQVNGNRVMISIWIS
jgi:hypothetical protein